MNLSLLATFLASSDCEKEAIRNFEKRWAEVVDLGNNLVRLHDQANGQFAIRGANSKTRAQ